MTCKIRTLPFFVNHCNLELNMGIENQNPNLIGKHTVNWVLFGNFLCSPSCKKKASQIKVIEE